MAKKRNKFPNPDALLYPDHKPPVTRRDFIKAGLMTGPAVVTSAGLLGLIARFEMAGARGWKKIPNRSEKWASEEVVEQSYFIVEHSHV